MGGFFLQQERKTDMGDRLDALFQARAKLLERFEQRLADIVAQAEKLANSAPVAPILAEPLIVPTAHLQSVTKKIRELLAQKVLPLNNPLDTWLEELDRAVSDVDAAMPANVHEVQRQFKRNEEKLKQFQNQCEDTKKDINTLWEKTLQVALLLKERPQREAHDRALFDEQERRKAGGVEQIAHICQTVTKQWNEQLEPTRRANRLIEESERQRNIAEAVRASVELRRSKLTQREKRRQVGFKLPGKVTDAPRVRIFDIMPPPFVDITQKYQVIQKDVLDKFGRFRWPSTTLEALRNECGADAINVVQRLAYHYFQPFNEAANVLFFHSPGSGKSCTARLCLSVFARAEYDIIISTPRYIRYTLVAAAVKNQCDFNVQQYTCGRPLRETVERDILARIQHKTKQLSDEDRLQWVQNLLSSKGKGKNDTLTAGDFKAWLAQPSEPKAVESETERSDLFQRNIATWLMHIILEDEMGYNQYGDIMDTASLEQLSNFVGGGAKGAREKFNKSYKTERQQDPLYKTCVIVDEAHHLSGATAIPQDEKPKFKPLRKLLWDSYRLSGKNAARVGLFTGTPAWEHPIDGVNLMTLLHDEQTVKNLGFAEYGNIDEPAQREAMEKKFMAIEWSGTRYHRQRKFEALFAGKVSFFNMVGDETHFSQPYVREGDELVPTLYWPQVQLSVFQTAAVARCLDASESPVRKVIAQRVSGLFRMKGGHLHSIGDEPPAFHTYEAKRKKETPPAQEEKEKKKKVRGGDEEEEEEPETLSASRREMVKKCLRDNVLWPWYASKDSMPINMSQKERQRWHDDDFEPMEQHSPLMAEFLRQFERKVDEGAQRATEDHPPMMNRKHFIYVDTIEDDLGVNNIMAWLRTMGFKPVNDGDKELTDTEYFKGVLVLNDDMKPDLLVAKFNSDANIDGRWALVALLNGKFKEGISLFHIYYEYILGFLATKSDLEQAVARGMRSCGRNKTPFPWTVEINIYSPSLPGPENLEVDVRYPGQLFQLLDPDSVNVQRAKDELLRLMRECAFDKLLLQEINEKSQRFTEHLSLFPPGEEEEEE